MTDMSAQEQLMLELINRARMDPNGEAKRLGIKLNEGVSKGDRISGDSKQVLAGNDDLAAAASNHSHWMLANDVFSHEEQKGTQGFTGKSPTSRAHDAGYDTSGGFVGENIAFTGSTGKIDKTDAIASQYRDLFLDKGVDGRGHRLNILNEDYREVGVGQETGKFRQNGTNFNASMITQDFGKTGTDVFVTGVIYDDKDKNDFFSVGEQVTGRAVSGPGDLDQTGGGGGYALAFASGDGAKTISFSLEGGTVTVDLTIGSQNLKVDIVNGTEVWTNASITGVSTNVTQFHALGIDDLDLTGSSSNEKYYGNTGQNTFTGNGGSDTFAFRKGDTAKSASKAGVIADFGLEDKIDVHAFDANGKKDGNQDFKFIDGDAFHHKPGELRFFTSGGDTIVEGDTTGDGKADFVIRLTGNIALTDAQFDL